MTRRVLGGLLLCSALGLGAIGAGPALATAPDGGRRPRLVDAECTGLIPTTVQADCHWLLVPEYHDRGDRARARELRLGVMVLHARAATPARDPVVFLAGGPGGDAIAGFENFLDSPMLEMRDIILLDQRGTGISEPSLDCPELEEAERLDFSRPESHDDELDARRAAAQQCRDRLVDEDVDLDAYDTRESAADVADLRLALGVDEWNLYGVSYGTRLALEVMRSFPEGVRSAVLDSVYPPDVNSIDPYVGGVEDAFGRLIDACNTDEACAELQPNLAGLIDDVVARYDEAPVPLTAANGDDFMATGQDVLAGLWDAMHDSDFIPTLPTVIEALAGGDTSILQVLADETDFGEIAEGAFLSVECADNGPPSADDETLAEVPGRTAVVVRHAAQPYCDLWDVRPLPRSFRRPVRSRIPTLVLAGSLDPITPASDSRRAGSTLRNAVYVELAGLGHVVTIPSDCARAIRQEFLEDPESVPEVSCADAPAPPFLTQGLI